MICEQLATLWKVSIMIVGNDGFRFRFVHLLNHRVEDFVFICFPFPFLLGFLPRLPWMGILFISQITHNTDDRQENHGQKNAPKWRVSTRVLYKFTHIQVLQHILFKFFQHRCDPPDSGSLNDPLSFVEKNAGLAPGDSPRLTDQAACSPGRTKWPEMIVDDDGKTVNVTGSECEKSQEKAAMSESVYYFAVVNRGRFPPLGNGPGYERGG